MADLEAELARFAAEVAAVEEEVTAQASAPAAEPAPSAPAVPSQPIGAPPARPVAYPGPPPMVPRHIMRPGPPPVRPPVPPGFPQPGHPHSPAAGPTATYQSVPVIAAPPMAPAPPAALPGPPPPLQAPPQVAPAAAVASSSGAAAAAPGAAAKLPKAVFRQAAGERWKDESLMEWPENDHRIFVGDIGPEVTDEMLSSAFRKYPSFAKAKVVKDSRSKKSKGFGFVSFLDVVDFAKAMREMNGKYIGNRPCKLRKSEWDERAQYVPGQKRGPGGGGGGGRGKTHRTF